MKKINNNLEEVKDFSSFQSVSNNVMKSSRFPPGAALSAAL